MEDAYGFSRLYMKGSYSASLHSQQIARIVLLCTVLYADCQLGDYPLDPMSCESHSGYCVRNRGLCQLQPQPGKGQISGDLSAT